MARQAWQQRGGSEESEQDGVTARSGAVAAPAGQVSAPPGRPPTAPASPQTLNRYAYALNNPLKYIDPTEHWTISVSFGGALFAMFGARGDITIAGDSAGNIGILVSGGGGGYSAAGGTLGLSATFTGAPTIHDLQGWSVQLGAGGGEMLGVGGECIFFQSGGVGYAGISVSGGARLQAPYPLEIHLTAAYAQLLGSCNIFSGVCSSPLLGGSGTPGGP